MQLKDGTLVDVDQVVIDGNEATVTWWRTYHDDRDDGPVNSTTFAFGREDRTAGRSFYNVDVVAYAGEEPAGFLLGGLTEMVTQRYHDRRSDS